MKETTGKTLACGLFHPIEEELTSMMAASSMTLRVTDEASAVPNFTAEEPATLMLDPEGNIHDCNGSAEVLFGFQHDELVSQPIALLLPQLSEVEWFQNGSLNPQLSFICHIGHQFHAVKRDGSRFASRLFFHDLNYGAAHFLRLIIRRAEGLA